MLLPPSATARGLAAVTVTTGSVVVGDGDGSGTTDHLVAGVRGGGEGHGEVLVALGHLVVEDQEDSVRRRLAGRDTVGVVGERNVIVALIENEISASGRAVRSRQAEGDRRRCGAGAPYFNEARCRSRRR